MNFNFVITLMTLSFLLGINVMLLINNLNENKSKEIIKINLLAVIFIIILIFLIFIISIIDSAIKIN